MSESQITVMGKVVGRGLNGASVEILEKDVVSIESVQIRHYDLITNGLTHIQVGERVELMLDKNNAFALKQVSRLKKNI